MKITRRQLKQIIKEASYNSMSDASKSLAQRAKRLFAKDYPDVTVGIDGRQGWILVNGKKAVNMSSASGRPMSLGDVVDKMKQSYLGHPMMEASGGMAITRRQLRRIIKEEIGTYGEGRVLKEYSDYPSWADLSDQIDDISEMLDMTADKYVTSAWLWSGENKGNAISNQIAEKLEQLYRDAEALGNLINTSGALK